MGQHNKLAARTIRYLAKLKHLCSVQDGNRRWWNMMVLLRLFWNLVFLPRTVIGLIMERNTIKNVNIALLSISFMMVFTGFNTMSGIQALIFKSATTPDSGGYVDGFSGD